MAVYLRCGPQDHIFNEGAIKENASDLAYSSQGPVLYRATRGKQIGSVLFRKTFRDICRKKLHAQAFLDSTSHTLTIGSSTRIKKKAVSSLCNETVQKQLKPLHRLKYFATYDCTKPHSVMASGTINFDRRSAKYFGE